MQFYSYYLQIRNLDKITINNYGRLFQQYAVDQWCKIEMQRLSFFNSEKGQKAIRANMYKNVYDAFKNDKSDMSNIGRRIILPSSFKGGPRNMHQLYQNAMALIRRYGKPDLFLTVTCNINWKEIQENLKVGESAFNRPDLCARVFKLKLKELMDDIIKNKIFGKIISNIEVIEFQKRGLPHAHILLILDKVDKPKTVDDYDKLVCAEIPNKKENPNLYETITRLNIHTPCSSKSSCNENGRCTKRFPKKIIDHTYEDENGYPLYRRRESEKIKIGKNLIDNSWVVPYNPYLSLKYNAHINVEICTTIKACKYLYKYVYKGNDKIVHAVTDQLSISL